MNNLHGCSFIVLTGGPGAGKSAVMQAAQQIFTNRVAILPESASIVYSGGFPRFPNPTSIRAAQRAIVRVQEELERYVLEEGSTLLALCDRGIADGNAVRAGKIYCRAGHFVARNYVLAAGDDDPDAARISVLYAATCDAEDHAFAKPHAPGRPGHVHHGLQFPGDLGLGAGERLVLIAALALQERIGPWRWAAVATGFIGVVVIAEPGGSADISMLGAALGLFSALNVAVINFQIRDLARTEQSISIVFYFAAFGTPMMAVLLPFFATSHDLQGWLLLVSIGIIGTIAQVFLTASLRFAPVSTVIVMDYGALIWASLYGWMIWDHLPTVATVMGAPLIIGAGLLIAWREHRLSRQPTTVTTLPPD